MPGNGVRQQRRVALKPPARLLRKLDQLITGRVAVIAAPPGYGKSELITAWLNEKQIPDPVFLECPLGVAELEGMIGQAPPDRDDLRVLVVDNARLIPDRQLARMLLDAAQHDPRLRVIFAGTARPDVALGALAARGLLVDLDTQDMALTLEEVTEALRVHTPEIGIEHLKMIMHEVRGWPVAIWLLAADHLTWPATQRIAGLMANFIESEVMSWLNEDDQDLLRDLSVLDSVDASSAAFVTDRPDAIARLARLQAMGIPLVWDEQNQVSMPPVMRRHLNGELFHRSPERASRLSARAVLWLRSRGRALAAIRQANSYGDTALAWNLAGEYILTHIYDSGFADQAEKLMASLPPSHTPWAQLIRASITAVSMPELLPIEVGRQMSRALMVSGVRGPLARVLMTLANARMHGYPPSVDLGEELQVLEQIQDRPLAEGVERLLLGLADVEAGHYLVFDGRPGEALPHLTKGIALVRMAGAVWSTVLALGTLALVYADGGNVVVAARIADESLALAKEANLSDTVLDENAMLARLMIACDRGEASQIEHWTWALEARTVHAAASTGLRAYLLATADLQRDDPKAALRRMGALADHGQPLSAFNSYLQRSIVFDSALAQGQVDQARATLDALGEIPAADPLLNQVRAARVDLATGNAEDAYLRLTGVLDDRRRPAEATRTVLEALMLLGVAADDTGRSSEALEAYQQAGLLAERLGLNTPSARHTRLAASSRREVALTEAERNVLAHLDGAASLSQTAAELYISVNTLKTHLRRIYRKLGVSRREEAIERSRLLGLV